MKKFLLFTFIICVAFVPKPAAPSHISIPLVQRSDTAILNDSLNNTVVVENDSKKDFRDLFLAASEKTEAYSVQLNPMAISFVQDYMSKHKKQLDNMKDWGKPYFDMMDGVLTAHGLPGELKYLAVIESNLKSNALSYAGAVGPWQFMQATARTLGLKVNHSTDERRDYFKSTNAAAIYLSDLFSIYGDWLLVIAAYNGGVANVNHAIKKSGSHDFWALQYYLPEESRNHVKKFIATHYIMEGDGGITTVTKEEAKDLSLSASKNILSDEEVSNSKTQTITGKYNSVVIAKYILMDISNFNRYNPDFDRQIGTSGNFELRLPFDKMDAFNAKKYSILEESMRVLLAPLSASDK